MLERSLRLMLALLALDTFSPVLAGPPLSIDDPGILEPMQLEFITATTLASTGAGKYAQIPLLDLSLGLIQDSVQLSVVYPFIYVNPDDGGSASDFGNPGLGVKWRFLSVGQLQMAVAPSYVFGVTPGVAAQGIGDQKDVMTVPVNAEYRFNDAWRINGEARYMKVDDGDDEWGYAAAVAYTLNKRWEFLFELSAITEHGVDIDYLETRVGFDATVTESVHVLFSIATGLREPNSVDKLDYDMFIGIQYFR